MKCPVIGRFCLVAAIGAAMQGCGNGHSAAPSVAGQGTDDAAFEVLSPEEAQAEAESAITDENADEAFADLQAEIEGELDGGG